MSTFAAAILDELMGRDRNSNPDEKKKELNWSDSETCKYFLCGFCPSELFTNTRADVGLCTKIHEDEFAKSYQGSSRYLKMGYEEDFLLYLQEIISEIDRKIKRNNARLSLNASHAKEQAQKSQEERVKMLSEKITSLLEKTEQLGCEGEVEEAQSTMKIIDTLRSERTQQELAMTSMQPIMMSKEMEVCPICGAFLVVGDAPQRIEEHLQGKLHMGYAKVRATIVTLKEKLLNLEQERDKKLKAEREKRELEKAIERSRDEKKDMKVEKSSSRRDTSSNRDRRRSRSPNRHRKDSSRKRSESVKKSHRKNGRSRSRSRKRDDRHSHQKHKDKRGRS